MYDSGGLVSVLDTMGCAGFYAHYFGALPYVFGQVHHDEFPVYRVRGSPPEK